MGGFKRNQIVKNIRENIQNLKEKNIKGSLRQTLKYMIKANRLEDFTV